MALMISILRSIAEDSTCDCGLTCNRPTNPQPRASTLKTLPPLPPYQPYHTSSTSPSINHPPNPQTLNPTKQNLHTPYTPPMAQNAPRKTPSTKPSSSKRFVSLPPPPLPPKNTNPTSLQRPSNFIGKQLPPPRPQKRRPRHRAAEKENRGAEGVG